MKQSDIRAFVFKYIDKEGSPVEAITEYRHFNKEKVLKEQDEIVSFFNNIYDFKDIMDLYSLLTDKEGNKIFSFKRLYDLDDFEDLLGLLLISNIFQDNFILRFEVMKIIGKEITYFERDFNDLNTLEDEENYVSHIEHCILPYYRFRTNMNLLEECKNKEKKKIECANIATKEESKSDIYSLKEILGYWFHKSRIPIMKDVDEYFDILLETKLEAVFHFAVMINIMHGDGPTSLVLNILHHKDAEALSEIEKKYSSFSKESKEKFDYLQQIFITNITKEMQEKNKSL